ncbi:DUF1153 domain-containing protein [Comamonas aquatica]|uniref:DUF1153 domain-containing protein n=1 Tax=Comamonas aquatica TaxID=225991 RepID=UPI002446A378|nr:DUF1153 domain-containing protein [Comamonas aquatica]MDH1767222.1 DUF1153 domain-containing protein [Comamonas aquatica]
MSTLMEDDIKRWTAKRKTALVLDIIQGKTTISEASRAFDLNPSEVEQWVDEGKRGMENESPRVLRRLQHLRRWSYDQVKQVLARGARACRTHGAGAPSRLPFAVGSH